MIVFVPICFFASTYAQISLGQDASEAGLFLLVFFGGFGIASQWGGRMLDSVGARSAMIPGAIIGAIGLFLWARAIPDLEFGNQWYWLAMGGAGCGLILSPAATDAMNRVPDSAYGEVTGLTQTVPLLRLQPRPRGARLDPDHADADQHRGLARRRWASRRTRRTRSPPR